MTGEKNPSNDNDMKGLVVFKEEKAPKDIMKETISYEEVDQEDKIKIVHELKPHGSYYRYTLLVANQSQAPISEAKIKVRFPEFVDLVRCHPIDCCSEFLEMDEGEKQIKLVLEEVAGNSQQQFSFYLAPLDLEPEGEVRSYLTFINNEDYVRAIDSKPILLMFTPITIEKKILPTSQIKEFSEAEGNRRAMKSIGIETEFDPDLFFNLIKQVLEAQNYQLITNIDKSRIAWYFGMELVSGIDVLVVAQVIKNKLEFIVVSKNPHINVSVLTQLKNELMVLLLFRDIIKSPQQVYNLECENCGINLSYFPKKGELIKCKNCKHSQMIW